MQRNYSVSSELLSFCARRQLSLGTTATGVDKSDEGEGINKVDDHSQSIQHFSVPTLFKFSIWLSCSPCLQFNVAAAVMQFLLDQHQTMT